MAYSKGDLRREIIALVSVNLATGRSIRWTWLVTDVLSKHPLPLIPDHDFNVICRRLAVAEKVRDVLSDLKSLPGYEYLQQGYPVDRDGEIIIVPINQMTRVERLARAAQYRKMSAGCLAHAEELERYDGDSEAA